MPRQATKTVNPNHDFGNHSLNHFRPEARRLPSVLATREHVAEALDVPEYSASFDLDLAVYCDAAGLVAEIEGDSIRFVRDGTRPEYTPPPITLAE